MGAEIEDWQDGWSVVSSGVGLERLNASLRFLAMTKARS